MKSALCIACLVALFGCSESPVTTIDRSQDCSKICDRYKTCLNSDYDTDACENRCTDMKDPSETDTIDKCSDCIGGDSSCVDNVFKCTTECDGIVP
jgi:hypothetical protein